MTERRTNSRSWMPGRSPIPVRSLVAISLACGMISDAQTSFAASNVEIIGLIITQRQFAQYETKDGREECPDGMQFTNAANFKAQFPTAAQQNQQIQKFGTRFNRGPNGENVWVSPDVIKDPLPMREVRGKHAIGLNLDGTQDGRATSTTCAHQKFTSPETGEAVDNQLYRSIGCQAGYRSPIDDPTNGYQSGFRKQFQKEDGINRILLELKISHVGSGDDDVEITTYRGKDRPAEDAAGSPLPWQSERIDGEAQQYVYHIHGKLKDGELITDPIDYKLPESFNFIPDSDHIYGMRMRLKLTPTGASGILSGYTDLEQFWESYSKDGQAFGDDMGTSAPTIYEALHRLADGAKDPQTGQCKAISEAFNVEFVRAYLIHPIDENKLSTIAQGAK